VAELSWRKIFLNHTSVHEPKVLAEEMSLFLSSALRLVASHEAGHVPLASTTTRWPFLVVSLLLIVPFFGSDCRDTFPRLIRL
jgi:hypothetical protein